MQRSLAYVISPHGFGHAARSSAVMAAIHDLDPGICFDIFTTVSPRFFQDSLSGPFRCHPVLTDIGLAQKSPFEEDLDETVRQLDGFLPFNSAVLDDLSAMLRHLGCKLVICDIAAIGIAAAQKARIPSVLVENFTWDWIYESYQKKETGFQRHIDYLKTIFSQADVHVQAEPVCRPVSADITVPPVSRRPKTPRPDTRRKLGVPEDQPLILISTGGIPEDYYFDDILKQKRDMRFILAGFGNALEQKENLIYLPRHAGVYHPDIVHAADAVVGKAGYSTLAEVYHAGLPFGYISRPAFREADILDRFIHDRMVGLEIGEHEFRAGDWVRCIDELLQPVRRRRVRTDNGAIRIADLVMRQLAPA